MLLSHTVLAGPLLITYVVGMVLAARYWRRAPRPAMFAMSGLALLLLATVVGSAVQAFLLANTPPAGMAGVGTRLQLFGFAFTLLRAAGMGLVVAAVFTARGTAGGFDVQPVPDHPPLANLAPQNSGRT